MPKGSTEFGLQDTGNSELGPVPDDRTTEEHCQVWPLHPAVPPLGARTAACFLMPRQERHAGEGLGAHGAPVLLGTSMSL